MFNKEKKINYYNYFLRKKQTTTLQWVFDEGYDTPSNLMGAIMNEGHRKNSFLYVYFNNMYYGISINDEKIIIITKHFILYHVDGYILKNDQKYGPYMKIYKRGSLKEPIYTINHISAITIKEYLLLDDLKSFDSNVKCGFVSPDDDIKKMLSSSLEKDKKYLTYLSNCCLYIFSKSFFDTYLFVFDLNATDNYFKKDKDKISRKSLHKEGIKKINPFSNCVIITDDENSPYSLSQYIADKKYENRTPEEKKKDKIMNLYSSFYSKNEPTSLKELRKKQKRN